MKPFAYSPTHVSTTGAERVRACVDAFQLQRAAVSFKPRAAHGGGVTGTRGKDGTTTHYIRRLPDNLTTEVSQSEHRSLTLICWGGWGTPIHRWCPAHLETSGVVLYGHVGTC